MSIPRQVLPHCIPTTCSVSCGDIVIQVTDWVVKGRPDEISYKKYPELWKFVPRGCCDIKIFEPSTPPTPHSDPSIQFHLRGLRKFGYENDLSTWSIKATDPQTHEKIPPSIFSKVYMTKENGECFHLTCHFASSSNTWYIVMGSKNVHFCWPVKNLDIFFHADSARQWLEEVKFAYGNRHRYDYAFMLAAQLLDTLTTNHLSSSNFESFLTYLATNQLTAVGEACDMARAQHLVVYPSPSIKFIALVNSSPDAPFNTLCYVDPIRCLNIFNSFHLDTPKNCKKVCEFDLGGPWEAKIIRQTEKEKNSEGAVVYVMNEVGNVVGMYKHKNDTYVMMRALREQVKKQASSASVEKRLNNLHIRVPKSFMRFALRFNAWVKTMMMENRLEKKDLDNSYLEVVDQYMEVLPDEIDAMVRKANQKQVDSSIIIVMVGSPCQGSGKTRLAQTLTHLLNHFGVCTFYCSQDQCGAKRNAYLKTIKSTIQTKPGLKVVIVDKWNNAQNRKDYYDMATTLDKECRFAFVGLLHPGGKNLHIAKSLENIQKRGNNHLSLRCDQSDANDVKRVEKILKSFYGKWSSPDLKEEKDHDLLFNVTLDMMTNTEHQTTFMFRHLQCAGVISDEATLTPDIVSAGIHFAQEYEEKCGQSQKGGQKKLHIPKSPKVLYYGVRIPNTQTVLDIYNQHLKPQLTGEHSFSLIPQNKFHCTLAYRPGPDMTREWKPRIGQRVELKVEAIYYDNKAATIKIQESFNLTPNTQKQLHVTLALTPGVAPYYSNTLLLCESLSPTVIPFPTSGKDSIVLEGVIDKFC